jgi:excisionase family DNA binding protein
MPEPALLTTAQAARRLGVKVRWVQALIVAGRLPAHRFGRAYLVPINAVAALEGQGPRRRGRPPRTTEKSA